MSSVEVRLKSALRCWHESLASARTDPLVVLASDGAFLQTDRPVPSGTTLFLELPVSDAPDAEKAGIDAVAEGARPDLGVGFFVRFVHLDANARLLVDQQLEQHAAPQQADEPLPRTPTTPPSASLMSALFPGEPAPPPAAPSLAEALASSLVPGIAELEQQQNTARLEQLADELLHNPPQHPQPAAPAVAQAPLAVAREISFGSDVAPWVPQSGDAVPTLVPGPAASHPGQLALPPVTPVMASEIVKAPPRKATPALPPLPSLPTPAPSVSPYFRPFTPGASPAELPAVGLIREETPTRSFRGLGVASQLPPDAPPDGPVEITQPWTHAGGDSIPPRPLPPPDAPPAQGDPSMGDAAWDPWGAPSDPTPARRLPEVMPPVHPVPSPAAREALSNDVVDETRRWVPAQPSEPTQAQPAAPDAAPPSFLAERTEETVRWAPAGGRADPVLDRNDTPLPGIPIAMPSRPAPRRTVTPRLTQGPAEEAPPSDATRPWATTDLRSAAAAARAAAPPDPTPQPMPRNATPPMHGGVGGGDPTDRTQRWIPAPGGGLVAASAGTPPPRLPTPTAASWNLPPTAAPAPRMTSLDFAAEPPRQPIDETMRWPTAQLHAAPLPAASAEPVAPSLPTGFGTQRTSAVNPFASGMPPAALAGAALDAQDAFTLDVTDPGGPPDDDGFAPAITEEDQQPQRPAHVAAATVGPAGPVGEPMELLDAEIESMRDMLGVPLPAPAAPAAPVARRDEDIEVTAVMPQRVAQQLAQQAVPSGEGPPVLAPQAPHAAAATVPYLALEPLEPLPPSALPRTATPLVARTEPYLPVLEPLGMPSAQALAALAPPPTTSPFRTQEFVSVQPQPAADAHRPAARSESALLHNAAAPPPAPPSPLPEDDTLELTFEVADMPEGGVHYGPGAWTVEPGPLQANPPSDHVELIPLGGAQPPAPPQANGAIEDWVVPGDDEPA